MPLAELLSTFDKTSLEDLDRVKLLNRIDTKFLFHAQQLPDILEKIKPDYLVLEINHNSIFGYETLYFDTPDFDLYKLHHNGKPNRLKVRFRKYSDSGLIYFEVKYKIKNSRTNKKRIKQDQISTKLSAKQKSMIYQPSISNDQLLPKMWVNFQRITLVNKAFNERLTLDTNLSFCNESKRLPLDDLCIAEIKTDKSAKNSPILHVLKERRIHQMSFSKYSMAVAMLENIKKNNFKPAIIALQKILNYGK